MVGVIGIRTPHLSCLACTAATLLAVAALGGCGGGSGADDEPPVSASFQVTDATGAPVVGATVYLVPAGDVDPTPITGAQVNNGSAEDRDEPVEDQVRLNGASYPHGTTGPDG